jgi:2-(1,2-epoxy-1,2-dihydrophenyl)acetyl-CoA isomerase
MSETVRVTRDGALAVIALNRPAKLNALDGELMAALHRAAREVSSDRAVRAVLLRGEGAAFCAGGDVPLFNERRRELPELIVKWGRELHAAIHEMRQMEKPVLAAVHGAAAGAGLSLMLAADLAIAAADTRFTLAYANIGASPDGGSTYFLPRVVGYKKAMELALLPERFDAQTAQALGLLNWVVPAERLNAEAVRLAQRLASGPTRAYAEAKRLFNASYRAEMQPHMEEELQAFARCARTRDLAEGLKSFVEKRAPVFQGG